MKERFSGFSPDFKESTAGGVESAAVSIPADILRYTENSDALLYRPEHGIFGVFDGAGKRNPASHIALTEFDSELTPHPKSIEEAEGGLRRAFEKSLQEIEENEPKIDVAKGDIGFMTTATVAQLYTIGKSKWLSYLHIGDSRLMALRKDEGEPHRTADESMVHYYLRKGRITREQADTLQYFIDEMDDPERLRKYIDLSGNDITPESLEHIYVLTEHMGAYAVRDFFEERKFLSSAISSNRRGDVGKKPTIHSLPADDYFALIIMTDGILDNMKTSDVVRMMKELQHPEAKPLTVLQRITSTAQKAKYEPYRLKKIEDDITGIVLKI